MWSRSQPRVDDALEPTFIFFSSPRKIITERQSGRSPFSCANVFFLPFLLVSMADITQNEHKQSEEDDASEESGSVVVVMKLEEIRPVLDLSLSDDENDEEKDPLKRAYKEYCEAQQDQWIDILQENEWNNQEYPEGQHGAFDGQVIVMDEGGNIQEDLDDFINGFLEEKGKAMQQRKWFRKTYVNPSTKDLRRVAKILRAKRGPNAEKLTGPLSLDIDYYFKPSRHQFDYWHTKVPDLDNMIKFSLDAMNQAGFFVDDRQVCRIVAQKTYCDHEEESRVEYKLSKLHL